MRRLLVLALLLALGGSRAAAQEARPTIGLVLSGGGARGLAHVGVLRELERMRVPVDLVTGTSMGAIVGGLYAAGVSPEEIAAVVDTVSWPDLMADRPPRSALDFRHRALERRYSLELKIGLGGPGLPAGLIAGQTLQHALRRNTLSVAAVEDFSELPTPFAAIATDLERAEPVVLRSGDLVLAMRASMAIPIVFTPVELDDRLLVDGGIVDNLPVELAVEEGADVTIAVDIAPDLKAAPELRTLFAVASQLGRILSRQNMERQLDRADLVIAPDLEGYDIFAFTEADSIVERGAAATRAARSSLEPYALDPAAYAAWRASRQPPPLPATIDAVTVGPSGWVDPRRILARVDLAPGDSLAADRLESAARSVYALGAFERVEYDLERRGERTVAVLRPVPDPLGPSTLRFGLDLVTDSGGADFRTGIVTFTGVVAWIREGLNARGGAARVETRLGQTTGLRAGLHQPVDFAGRWFVEPELVVESERQPLFEAADLPVSGEYAVLRREARLAMGRALGLSARAALGVARARVDAEAEPRPLPRLPDVEEDVATVEAAITVDRLDKLNWPTGGTLLDARWTAARRWLGSDRDWERLDVEAKGFLTTGGTTGFASLRFGSALGTRPPAFEDFRSGGFLSLSGFGTGALRGPYGGVARVGAYRRVTSVPPAFRGVFVGAWGEAGNAWRDSEDVDLGDLEWAGTVVLGAETILGPLYVAYGAGSGEDRVYVALGPEL